MKKCLACKTKENLTIDHIKPRSLGGNDRKNNIQILCKSCNSIKGCKTIDFSKGVPVFFKKRLSFRKAGIKYPQPPSRTIYIDDKTHKRLKIYCIQKDITLSKLIREFLASLVWKDSKNGGSK